METERKSFVDIEVCWSFKFRKFVKLTSLLCEMAKDVTVISKDRWDEIVKWIPNNEQEEEEERILNYLQEASAAMKAKWPENQQKEIAKKVKTSSNPDVLRYEAIKNADAEKRRQMIEEAEKFVSSRKIKECPIDLRSAAILSENLAGRKIQLEFQAAHRAEEKAKTLIRNKIDMAQSVAWLQDGFVHRTNAYRIAREHKKGLLDMINERKSQRDDEKAKRIAEEKKIIEQHNKNIEDQKIRDRKVKEEQTEYMRKHEVETVLMAKQKRERIKRENEVIDVLAKVHNEGKNKIKELIKIQENQARFERVKLDAKLGDMAQLRHDAELEKLKHEQVMIEKARIEKEKILDSLDLKHKAKRDFLKNDRTEDYSQSLKAAEVRKAVQKEEDKEYFENRIMNDKVSHEYTRMKKQMKVKKTKENLEFLKMQAKELRNALRQERNEEINDLNIQWSEDTTDEKFFEYAQDLLDDASSKNRPLKPIHMVTKAYKNRHFIDIKKRLRPHEISNVPIEEEIQKIESDKGKSKRMLKYEKDEKLLASVYRTTKFLNPDK